MSELNIYKASAGSGKTFSLTLDYFRLIFENPNEYRSILAVTFTNKATEEMKSRIIKELHKLAEGKESSYGSILQQDLGVNKDVLKNRAATLRTLLLHDYGHLSVTTIDRFFQRIVKAFTRELGIFPGYNVELDSDYVLVKAVDLLMEEVGRNSELRNWILDLMNSSVDEGRSWNIKGKIADLGEELFKENYMLFDKETLSKFNDKAFLKTYRRSLHELIKHYEQRLTDLSDRAIAIIDSASLNIEDFKNGKRGCVNHFYKLREGKFDQITNTVIKAVDDIDVWVTKSADKDIKARIESVFPQLNKLLGEAVNIYDQECGRYTSAIQINSNLYQLGILNDLYGQIRRYCEENGVMLLSDTTRILNLLIAGNDTSFLFEKSGNRYKHIMIDEFQDTSSMQWQNFRPLLANTLSENNHALIVGDVKQSIYRWRNGDWTLLADKVENEFKHFGSKVTVLGNNWRSAGNIVEFNNLFFDKAASYLKELYDETAGDGNPWSESITHAYSDIAQRTETDVPGYVDILFGPEKREEESFAEIMQKITVVVEDITDRGGALKEVVILVRSGKEGEFVADYLMEYNKTASRKISFVSNDSLYVNASPYVKFIVTVLRYIVEPYDAVNRATALFLYISHIRKEQQEQLFGFYKGESSFQEFEKQLSAGLKDIVSFSLFETVEMIIDRFRLKDATEEIAYLIAFQDVIYEYECNNSNNILLFLEWWEKEEKKRVLTTSEHTDALKILTIHKAKGLEFDYVLLPFCCWELDAVRPFRRIWCDITDEAFKGLEYIPLTYSSKLSETIFAECYYDEHLKAYVDNLNLLYVALTRAKKELYVRPFSPQRDRGGQVKVSDIGAFIYKILENMKDEEDRLLPEEDMSLKLGEKIRISREVLPEHPNLTLSVYPVNEFDARIAVKYSFKEYSEPEQAAITAINEGNLLHEIFRLIKYKEDVDRAVEKVYRMGLIAEGDIERYKGMVGLYIEDNRVKEWYDANNYTVINERDILLDSGSMIRPDRVMIKGDRILVVDYKFGKKEDEKYTRQILFYKKTLKALGYGSVEAFIWYVGLDKIEEV